MDSFKDHTLSTPRWYLRLRGHEYKAPTYEPLGSCRRFDFSEISKCGQMSHYDAAGTVDGRKPA